MINRTQSLFHFTKKFETLKAILESGYFWARYSLEDISWGKGEKRLYYALPMVCFCDIPLSRIEEHTEFYGGYGIAMTQEWGIRNGLNPLIYLNTESPLRNHLTTALLRMDHEKNELEQEDKSEGETKDERESTPLKESLRLMSFIKGIRGHAYREGTQVQKNFYEESEWRYVPTKLCEGVDFVLSHEQYNDTEKLTEANEKSRKEGPLTFALADIRYIFVNTISEVPLLYDFINATLGHYPANQLKILISRIASLEDLKNDI